MRKVLAAVMAGMLALSTGASLAQAPPPAPAAWTIPSDAEIRQILIKRIDAEHRGVGIVVGLIDAHGRRIVAYGASDKGDRRPLDGGTIFEIGSMTKVFTSLLLADMVQKGEVKLDDPVAKYLPPGVKMPQRGGKQITLIDLSTHTSGLPRMPSNFRPKDPGNPYADYTVQQMYDFLSGYTLPRDIGSQFEYSNLGVGLLGHVLARRAGADYETLVRQRITGPLGMKDTAITLTPALQARLAKGHDDKLQPVSNWDLPTLAGAGALRSDVNDMLTFLGAELGFAETPLKGAMAAQLVIRHPVSGPDMIAEAWMVRTYPGGGTAVWHNGGTGGYRTLMAFDPKARVGVVVLTNASTDIGGDDIGFHILAGRHLSEPPPEHHAIVLEPAAMAKFVGRYQLSPNVYLTVSQYGARMVAQITGQPVVEIFPEGPTEFFYKAVDAQLVFRVEPDGKVSGLLMRQNGQAGTAKRLEDAPPHP
jgi:CubicO group peptidase (beta-lactamase class C family)